MQLFEAEEAYNELLHEYNGYVEKKKKKRFFDSETQTLNSACTDCKKGQTLIEEKTADIVALRLNVSWLRVKIWAANLKELISGLRAITC